MADQQSSRVDPMGRTTEVVVTPHAFAEEYEERD